MTFSQDQRFLLTFNFDGQFVIRNAKSMKVIASKQLETLPKDEFLEGARFFNHGKQLLVKPPGDAKDKLWDLSPYLNEIQNLEEK